MKWFFYILTLRNRTVYTTFVIVMKQMLIFLFLFGCLISCNSSKKTISTDTATSKEEKTDTIVISNDTLEYEIIILEQGFERYLITQPKASFYSTTYLENKNIIYVREYNRRVRDIGRSRDLYPQEINYNPKLRYGKEVNFLLFNYFQFFEYKYNQKLK